MELEEEQGKLDAALAKKSKDSAASGASPIARRTAPAPRPCARACVRHISDYMAAAHVARATDAVMAAVQRRACVPLRALSHPSP